MPLRRPLAAVALVAAVAAPTARAVDLDALPATPRTYAAEIIASPGAPVVLDNPGGVLDLSTPLDYSFSVGEVRYARIECPGIAFGDDTAVAYAGAGNAGIGAVNGLGDDVIHFSITAADNAVVADDRLVVTGTRAITSTRPVDCRYGLYDQPSQAATGGALGRIAGLSGRYLDFAPSHALKVDVPGYAVADVEPLYPPAFSAFETAAPTFHPDLANLGGFSYGTRLDVLGETQPLSPAGAPLTLADLMGPATALVFERDFSTAADVYLSTLADCSTIDRAADAFDLTGARFIIGSDAVMARFLCFLSGDAPVDAADYSVSLDPVPAAPAVYAPVGSGPLPLGRIVRNGLELQAPLAEVPAEYLSRLVIANRGPQGFAFRIEVLGETGNVISTGLVSGVVQANATRVIEVSDIITGTTGEPRAALKLTVAAPNANVQALYQVVNPAAGTISNHVMVRPGTN